MKIELPDQSMPSTRFNFLHCHKWIYSLQEEEKLQEYLIYWQAMIKKMQLIAQILIRELKDKAASCSPSEQEIEQYNTLFKEDVARILENKKLNARIQLGVDARIQENREMVKVALLMGNIAQRYGLEYLIEIVERVKGEFADKLYEIFRQRKARRGGMAADHYIERKKQKDSLVTVFYNCPIFGVFSMLGLEAPSRAFCILCDAHGKKGIQELMPFKADIYIAKSFSRNEKHCEFIMQAKSPFIRLFIRFLPLFIYNVGLGIMRVAKTVR
jgi:hypothetical protein